MAETITLNVSFGERVERKLQLAGEPRWGVISPAMRESTSEELRTSP